MEDDRIMLNPLVSGRIHSRAYGVGCPPITAACDTGIPRDVVSCGIIAELAGAGAKGGAQCDGEQVTARDFGHGVPSSKVDWATWSMDHLSVNQFARRAGQTGVLVSTDFDTD